MAKKSSIGGQAVMEGVMMRGNGHIAMAVRNPKGDITLTHIDDKKYGTSKIYFWRGVVNFISMLRMGMDCISTSAQICGESTEEEYSKFELWLAKKTGRDIMDIVTPVAMVLGIGLAVLLFMILPNLLVSFVSRFITSPLLINLLEGVLRLAIFIGYMLAVSMMNDIKRVFRYHGAEHKTIMCYEAGDKLTVENVQKHTMQHPRCGTSFMLFVMVISILVFSLTGWGGTWYTRILIRLALLPVVASLSYELLMLLAKSDNIFFRILRWPGLQLQKLSTAQPDDSMVEVAIAAFAACLPPSERADVLPEGYTLPGEEPAQPEQE